MRIIKDTEIIEAVEKLFIEANTLIPNDINTKIAEEISKQCLFLFSAEIHKKLLPTFSRRDPQIGQIKKSVSTIIYITFPPL
jgi:hypothetical protein